jgi:tRNA-specific 2-thiouridylase
VPTGRYTDIIERLKPNAASPATSSISTAACSAASGHRPFHRRPAPRPRHRLGAPLYVVRLDAASRRVVVGPREALRMDRIVLRDVNWIGDGALERALADERLEMFVRVRSTRAPQPAWLRAPPMRL